MWPGAVGLRVSKPRPPRLSGSRSIVRPCLPRFLRRDGPDGGGRPCATRSRDRPLTGPMSAAADKVTIQDAPGLVDRRARARGASSRAGVPAARSDRRARHRLSRSADTPAGPAGRVPPARGVESLVAPGGGWPHVRPRHARAARRPQRADATWPRVTPNGRLSSVDVIIAAGVGGTGRRPNPSPRQRPADLVPGWR